MARKRTLIDLFEESVQRYPQHIFLREKIGSEWQTTTYAQTHQLVTQLGAGFVSLGFTKGEYAALLSEGRNSWIVGELALFYAGVANVPLSVKLEESNDLLFRLIHSEAHYLLVSKGQLHKVRKIKDRLPSVKYFILLDDIPQCEEREVCISEVYQMGIAYLKEHRDSFMSIGQSLQNDDVATITYTSGTTADPKGVMLTHRNYTANVEQALTLVDIPSSYRTLIILPLDHCFAHVVGFYIFMHRGASVATVQVGRNAIEALKNIPINIKEIQPDLLLSVPALAKTFRKSIESSIKAKGKGIECLFNYALKLSYKYNRDGWSKGKGLLCLYKPLLWLFDQILFSKVREGMGGKLKMFIGGGALLDRELQDFYYAIGMPMLQGYGLSEATPVISSNTPKRHKFGTSGVLVQPLDIVIKDAEGNILPAGEKGEIVVRGENVMAGYYKNETATAETVKEGWLYTGDMGYMDRDGFLVVLGRFKSLLIGSDGEKYSPEGIEEALMSQPYIDQVVLHNNQSPYTVALIVPNIAQLKGAVTAAWGSEEAKREAIGLVQQSINAFKGEGKLAQLFPSRWLPTTFALIDTPFSEQNGLVNSSLKVVRGKVERCYAHRLELLYRAEGKDIYHSDNLAVMQ